MTIEDQVKGLKELVERVFSKKPEGEIKPYDPGTSDEWQRRRSLAKRMYRILTQNPRS